MKVAVAQISCSLGDPESNLSKVRDFSRRAKGAGADLIVFPEMTDTGYSMPVIQKHANDWKTGFVPGLQQIAREHCIAIVVGVSERDGSSIYNSQVLVDANGRCVAQVDVDVPERLAAEGDEAESLRAIETDPQRANPVGRNERHPSIRHRVRAAFGEGAGHRVRALLERTSRRTVRRTERASRRASRGRVVQGPRTARVR